VALTEDVSTGDGRQWRYLPAHALSPDAKVRFAQLFDIRRRWTLEDISPYTTDLATPTMAHEQLLLKHTRVIVADGKSFHSPR
jgi:hypothetical protein